VVPASAGRGVPPSVGSYADAFEVASGKFFERVELEGARADGACVARAAEDGCEHRGNERCDASGCTKGHAFSVFLHCLSYAVWRVDSHIFPIDGLLRCLDAHGRWATQQFSLIQAERPQQQLRRRKPQVALLEK